MALEPPNVDELAHRRQFDLKGRTLREHTARGAVINTGFMAGLTFLGFIRGFVLAGFLTAADYGVWGLTIIALSLVTRLKQVGIGDKYIQQDEDDQELAFQKAFTLEAIVTGAITVLVLVTLPLFAAIYGEPKIVAPALVLTLNLVAGLLQMPVWTFYRQMDFMRQRLVQAVDPIVTIVVSIALAASGAGYWALFIGVSAGAWSMAVVALLVSPYKLRFRYDRGTVKEYWRFSGPLLLVGLGGPLIAYASLLGTQWHLGIAAVGALTLASTITQFTDRVDGLVTGTLYPAICAVANRTELLYESFVKSNRLALMWAMPFGIGLSLFCGDLVHYVIGDRWEPTIPLLQVFGVVAAFGHLGFNWDAYFRARGETRPIAVAAIVASSTFIITGAPLLLLYDLPGLAAAVAAQSAAHVAVRAYYLRGLFNGFAFLRHAGRAMLPSVPPALLVLAMRLVESGERSAATAALEFALYIVVTVIFTWMLERTLLREAMSYLRPSPPAAGSPANSPA